jgi:hypothetical protein
MSVGARIANLPVQAEEGGMNWDQIEGKWKQVVGSAREKWGAPVVRDVPPWLAKKP